MLKFVIFLIFALNVYFVSSQDLAEDALTTTGLPTFIRVPLQKAERRIHYSDSTIRQKRALHYAVVPCPFNASSQGRLCDSYEYFYGQSVGPLDGQQNGRDGKIRQKRAPISHGALLSLLKDAFPHDDPVSNVDDKETQGHDVVIDEGPQEDYSEGKSEYEQSA